MDNVHQPSGCRVFSTHNITKLMNISKELILYGKAALERNNSIPSGKSISVYTINTLVLFFRLENKNN